MREKFVLLKKKKVFKRLVFMHADNEALIVFVIWLIWFIYLHISPWFFRFFFFKIFMVILIYYHFFLVHVTFLYGITKYIHFVSAICHIQEEKCLYENIFSRHEKNYKEVDNSGEKAA